MRAVPMNWPIGDGPDFQGGYDLRRRQVHLFERTAHGTFRAPEQVTDLQDPRLVELLTPRAAERLYVATSIPLAIARPIAGWGLLVIQPIMAHLTEFLLQEARTCYA